MRASGAAADEYVYQATRALGTLVPPSRPGFGRGMVVHVAISMLCGETLVGPVRATGGLIQDTAQLPSSGGGADACFGSGPGRGGYDVAVRALDGGGGRLG
jgi:hypothetical protein